MAQLTRTLTSQVEDVVKEQASVRRCLDDLAEDINGLGTQAFYHEALVQAKIGVSMDM